MSQLGDPDSGETSICCQPQYAPIYYHWYSSSGERLIDAFRRVIGSAALPDDAKSQFVGNFRATMRMLERGELRPLKNLKGPMRKETRLSVFEVLLRHIHAVDDDKELIVRVRLYHAEPSRLKKTNGDGSAVVGLHVHHKDIASEDVAGAQDVEIAVASERFFEGRPTAWGLRAPGSSP